MDAQEKKIVLKLLEAWEREAKSYIVTVSSHYNEDLAKLDEAKERWKLLLGI